MDSATVRKPDPPITDNPFCFDRKYYERFFVLKVRLRIGGEDVKLTRSKNREMCLRSTAAQQQTWKLPCELIQSVANQAGNKYGIAQVGTLWFADRLVMHVEFANSEDIEEFLHALRKQRFEKCVEAKLQKQAKELAGSVSFLTSLHFVEPLGGREASFTKVTFANLQTCLESMRRGNQFDYGEIMAKGEDSPQKRAATNETVSTPTRAQLSEKVTLDSSRNEVDGLTLLSSENKGSIDETASIPTQAQCSDTSDNKINGPTVLSPDEKVLDYEKDFHSVLEATIHVMQWFTLGSLLKIKPSLLEGIEMDHPRDHHACHERMLLAWLKTGEATWFSLICALRTMGHTDLVETIAQKRGIPLPAKEALSDKPHEQELPIVVHPQCSSMEEKAQQLTLTGRKVDQAEKQNILLKRKLSDLLKSSEKVAVESSKLVLEKKELERQLILKQTRKERLEDQRLVMTDTQLAEQMLDEVQVSIDEIQMNIKELGKEIEEQNKEKEKLNDEIAIKQKELEKSEHDLQESKERYAKLELQLHTDRIAFDLQLRQQQHSSEVIEEELKEQIADKQKEVEKGEHDLQKSKENYSKLEQQLADERREFDLLMLQQAHSTDKMQVELKEQIANKQNEVEKSECKLQELKENYSQLEQQLQDDRRAFEHLRQAQSTDKIQEELRAQIEQLKRELNRKNEPKFDASVLNLITEQVNQKLQQQKQQQQQQQAMELPQEQQQPQQSPRHQAGPRQEKQQHPLQQEKDRQQEKHRRQHQTQQQPQPQHHQQQQLHPDGGTFEKTSTPAHDQCGSNVSPDTSGIKVDPPTLLCVGRLETVMLTTDHQEALPQIRAELTKKGKEKGEVVAITNNKENRSCLLLIKPQEEGEHILSITVNGHPIPHSPYSLLVDNLQYYGAIFKQPVQTIEVDGPRHIAISSNGDIFVISTYSHSIHVYNKHGQKKREIGKRGRGNVEFYYPYGIAICENVMYIADCENHRVQCLSTDGTFLSTFGSHGSGDGELKDPRGLTIGPDGMLYVSDSGNHRVVVFSKAGDYIRNIDVSASVRRPQGLAVSADGNLHVAGYESNNYAVFSPAGKLIKSHRFVVCADVAIDGAGCVFATRLADNNSLTIFDSNGEPKHTITLNYPWGVAVASDGSVWVAGFKPEKLWKF